MQRPKNLYPTPPKLEMFINKPTGLKSVTTWNEGSKKPDVTLPQVGTSYSGLDVAKYKEYLAAHVVWVEAVDSLDQQLHEIALRNRCLEKFREVPVLTEVRGHPTPTKRDPVIVPHYPGLQVIVRSELKTEHPPVPSTQPHQAEKRANRKKARDARVKVQANAAEAKAELLLEKTVPVIKEQRKAVQTIAALAPLHRAELVAAKSAAARAAEITRGSKDLVTEVKPDDGWKVVTRKKGDYRNEMSQVVTVQGGVRNTVTTFKDPAVALPRAVMQPVRLPNSVGGKP